MRRLTNHPTRALEIEPIPMSFYVASIIERRFVNATFFKSDLKYGE